MTKYATIYQNPTTLDWPRDSAEKDELFVFDSLDTFLTFNSHETPEGFRSVRQSAKSGTSNFYGVPYAEAEKLAREGWPEGLALVKKHLGVNIPAKARTRNHDVAGDFLDVGRALSGCPASMTRRVITESKKKPMITLAVSCSHSCGVHNQAIRNYGAALASVIDDLEGLGFRVALYNLSGNGGLKIDAMKSVIVRVKAHDEILEAERLVFMTAHPSFLRRFCFRFIELAFGHNNDSNYGMPKTIIDAFRSEIDRDAIYFGSSGDGIDLNVMCRTYEYALNYVRSWITKQRPEVVFDNDKIAA